MTVVFQFLIMKIYLIFGKKIEPVDKDFFCLIFGLKAGFRLDMKYDMNSNDYTLVHSAFNTLIFRGSLLAHFSFFEFF